MEGKAAGGDRKTVLHPWHVSHRAKMVSFGGWDMPLHYEPGILAEHLATRKFGGLFDVSHMGRFTVAGKGALAFLQSSLTNNAAALEPGRAQYTMIPNETGGAVDDAYLYRLDDGGYLLVVNAANREKDEAWLRALLRAFPGNVLLEDRSEEISMFALQGPRSRAVLLELLGGRESSLPDPGRGNLKTAEIGGVPVPISRTGYTGEPLAFELFPPARAAVELWDRILEVGGKLGIVTVGLGARDTLRLEAALPLYGHELGADPGGAEIPIYAVPLSRFAVSFAEVKGDFPGRERLASQWREMQVRMKAGAAAVATAFGGDRPLEVPRRVVPVAVVGKGVVRNGQEIFAGDRLVGWVTSGTTVPYWKFTGEGLGSNLTDESARRPIALAYVDAWIEPGERLRVPQGRWSVEAIAVERHLRSDAPPYARPVLVEAALAPLAEPRKARATRETIAPLARTLVAEAVENTRWRQKRSFNLIPSEQTPSPIVRLLSISDACGRYAEHRNVPALGGAHVFYYQGTSFIEKVEERLAAELRSYLHCTDVETRVVSGQMANAVVFSSLLAFSNLLERGHEPRRLPRVMNHHLGRGGHLSSQPMGALRDFVAMDPETERPAVVHFPILPENPYKIDLARTAELIRETRPELIILGKSMVLHREPVREIAAIAAELPEHERPVLMYDTAHVLGLLGPSFQEPFAEGADIVTGSTHKTFFGTQRGIVAADLTGQNERSPRRALWETIERRTFPGAVSNHHLGTLLGLLMAAYEMNAFGPAYQKQVLANAKAFARALRGEGLEVEGDPAVGYTETHQVLVKLDYAAAPVVAERLEENNIVVNYQAVPTDESFTCASALRLGVQEMTRFGMKEADFAALASLMARVILKGESVGEEASRLRARFLQMGYCLPAEEASPLVESLVEAVGRG